MDCKGNHKQNKRTTYRIGGNMYKGFDQRWINFQNTQIAHKAQYQKKTKNKNKQTIYIHIFFQGRHTDSKQAHEKMVKITNY